MSRGSDGHNRFGFEGSCQVASYCRRQPRTAACVHTHLCKGEKREHVHLCVPVGVRNTAYAHVFMRAYMCDHTHVYVGGECVSAGIYTRVFARGMEDEGLIAPGVTRMLKPGLD